MSKYALWLKQLGDGCDYTIGCGNALHWLDATNPVDATKEALIHLEENTYPGDLEFEKAIVVEVITDLSDQCDSITEKVKKRNAEAEKAEKRRRLQKQLDELM